MNLQSRQEQNAHFRKYQKMIWQMAYKGAQWIGQIDPCFSVDDAYSLVAEVYCKCVNGFDESLNLQFTTYYRSACHWELLRYARKRAQEIELVLPMSVQDMNSSMEEGHDDYSFFSDELAYDPSEAIEQKQQYLENISRLSVTARRLVAFLIRPNEELEQILGDNEPSVEVIAAYMGLTPREAVSMRREFNRVLGVDIKVLNATRFR